MDPGLAIVLQLHLTHNSHVSRIQRLVFWERHGSLTLLPGAHYSWPNVSRSASTSWLWIIIVTQTTQSVTTNCRTKTWDGALDWFLGWKITLSLDGALNSVSLWNRYLLMGVKHDHWLWEENTASNPCSGFQTISIAHVDPASIFTY